MFEDDEDLPEVEEKDYILFASGRIMASKGVHLMLEALLKLNYQGRVLIIGNRKHSAEYSEYLESLARSLNVRFLDIIKDKKLLMAYLKNAKMFVFPSFHEGMSNMLLEAASANIPLICSDIPENVQVFDDHETFFFKAGDSGDLALKIEGVLNNSSLAREVAERAYIRLKKDYNWEPLSRRYAYIYNWLIEKNKPLNQGEPEFKGL
ncbi:glycosyltransferase family 4 protein [Marinilabilia sp.]